jgi:hypothetical protein
VKNETGGCDCLYSQHFGIEFFVGF